MRVERIELHRIRLPLAVPYEISSGTFHNADAILVQVFAEGLVGWGESAAPSTPFYSAETTDTCWLAIRDYLSPLVLGKDFRDAADLWAAMCPVRGHHFAKAGVETAFWDLLARASGQPLADFLAGGRGRTDAVPSGLAVPIHRSVGPLLEEVAGGIAEGYRRVKIKIKPGWDKEPLCAIRERFGDFPLFPDANSAYELKKHLGVFRELDTLDLMMVEQPLHHEDLVDHARLQREIKTPVCLDESVHSAAQARGAIELGSCRIVNVKIQRVGGLGQALRIHDLCRGKGIGLWCGTMPETGLGQAQGLALASLPGFTHPADLEPSARFFPEDVVDPPLVLDAEGRLPVPQGEGTGVEVRMDVVEKYKVAHLTLSP